MNLSITMKKISLSIIVLVGILLLMLPSAFSTVPKSMEQTVLDTRAETYLNDTLIKASAAFAAAKGINAVISLIQESTVNLQPFGVGVDVAAGQVLDPINDLVERASWIFLASMTSVGIQKFLIMVTPWFTVEVMLPLALVLILVSLWRPQLAGHRPARIATRILIAAIVLRLMIPVSALTYQYVYDRFLKDDYQTDMTAMQATNEHMVGLSADMDMLGSIEKGNKETAEEKGFTLRDLTPGTYWDKATAFRERITTGIAQVRDAALDTGDRLVRLITLFVIQTMVLPLLTIVLILAILRAVFTPRSSPEDRA